MSQTVESTDDSLDTRVEPSRGPKIPPAGRPSLGSRAPVPDASPQAADGADRMADQASPAMSMVGQTLLGQYRIVALLGEGGFGRVYLADHVRPGSAAVLRQAVVKVARPDVVHSSEAIQRFELEARALAMLNHQNLVTLYSFGELADGGLFLVMEYGGDETVRNAIQRDGSLTAVRALDIAEQVAEALGEAHRNHILHRDVKPSNILLQKRRSGDGEVAKLVDLGIAKIFGSFSRPSAQAEGDTLTGADVFIGTARYTSPEQAKGAAVDARSDLYSLGVVLYEMLTGRLPVSAPSTSAYLVAHVTQAPEPLAAAGVPYPRHLQALISKALQKDPNRRFQSAREMADAIATARARLESAERSLELGRRPAVVALVIAVALACTAFVSYFSSGRSRAAARVEAPRAGLSVPWPAVTAAAEQPADVAPTLVLTSTRRLRLKGEKPVAESDQLQIPMTGSEGWLEIEDADGEWTIYAKYHRAGGTTDLRVVDTKPVSLSYVGDRRVERNEPLPLTASGLPLTFRSPRAKHDFSLEARLAP